MKKRLSVIVLAAAGAAILAAPAQANPCDKHIHIHIPIAPGQIIHICMDRPA